MTEPRLAHYSLNEKKVQILEIKERRFNIGLIGIHGLVFVIAHFIFLKSIYPFKDIITFIIWNYD